MAQKLILQLLHPVTCCTPRQSCRTYLCTANLRILKYGCGKTKNCNLIDVASVSKNDRLVPSHLSMQARPYFCRLYQVREWLNSENTLVIIENPPSGMKTTCIMRSCVYDISLLHGWKNPSTYIGGPVVWRIVHVAHQEQSGTNQHLLPL